MGHLTTIELRGRLSGQEKTRLQNLFDMMYRPSELAEEIGDKRYTNVILLGGLVAAADFLDIKSIEKGLIKSLSGKKETLFEINQIALHKGANYKQ